MGLFTAAVNFRLLVLFLPTQIATSALPLMTRHLAAGELGHYSGVLRSGLWMTSAIALALAGGLALLAPWILTFFGAGFETALPLVRLLLAAAVLESIANALYQVLPSRGLMWHSFLFVGLPRDLSFIALATVLIPRLQSFGLGVAFLASQVISLAGILAARRVQNRGQNEF